MLLLSTVKNRKLSCFEHVSHSNSCHRCYCCQLSKVESSPALSTSPIATACHRCYCCQLSKIESSPGLSTSPIATTCHRCYVLLSTVKKRKLSWSEHVTHSNNLTRTILQGKGSKRHTGWHKNAGSTSNNEVIIRAECQRMQSKNIAVTQVQHQRMKQLHRFHIQERNQRMKQSHRFNVKECSQRMKQSHRFHGKNEAITQVQYQRMKQLYRFTIKECCQRMKQVHRFNVKKNAVNKPSSHTGAMSKNAVNK